MNYLKFSARPTASEDRPHAAHRSADLDEVERLLAEAQAIKNQIIRANLRLVVSIAKKRSGLGNHLFELVSDGRHQPDASGREV